MTDRLARLLTDLAAAGVSVRVEAGRVCITGMESDAWLTDWLQRNERDLLLLLRAPDRHQATRTPLPCER